MELKITNTTNRTPYGIGEIIHTEDFAEDRPLNDPMNAYETWCEDNLREGESRPQGVITDEDGNRYDAATGDVIED